MNEITSYIINQGLPPHILSYLILVPLVATLVAFSRQIIGIQGPSLYAPLLIAFVFLDLGLVDGIMIFLIIIFLANFFAYALKRLPLLYLPRITIVIASVALTLFVSLFLLYLAGIKIPLSPQSYLSIVIILALSDKYISTQIRKSFRSFVYLVGETLALGTASFYILNTAWVQSWVLKYPAFFLIAIIIINIFLGRFSGLRFSELIRFRHLLSSRFK